MEQLAHSDPGSSPVGELRRSNTPRQRRELDLKLSVEALACLGVPDGWKTFPTLAGQAIDWPTAYVGEALLRYGKEDAVQLVAARLLADQQVDGGWGYHTGVPEDSDSTAYAVAFLLSAGITGPQIDRGVARLLRLQGGDGAFSTYPDPSAVRMFMHLDASVCFAGWASVHPEVTAAAGRALALCGEQLAAEKCWAALRLLQQADGSWQAYWWQTDLYATSQVARLAQALGEDRGAEMIQARRWCRSLRDDQGRWRLGDAVSVFATALALQILGELDEEALEFLFAMRRRDGLWDGEPTLRIPMPWMIRPATEERWAEGGLGGGAVVWDVGHCYGSATVLLALSDVP
jgi:hypothetical protein